VSGRNRGRGRKTALRPQQDYRREGRHRAVGYGERPVVAAIADDTGREDVGGVPKPFAEDVLPAAEASVVSAAEQAPVRVEGSIK